MHYIWLWIDTNLPWGIQIYPILQGLTYYNYFRDGALVAGLKEYFSTNIYGAYSTMIGGLYFLFYCLFGIDHQMDLMLNAVFFLIGILGAYKCGALLFSKRSGILAAVLWSSLPVVISYSKQVTYEYPLMCFVPLMLFYWLRSDSFRSFKYSMMFGIIISMIIAFKPEGVVFGLVPLGQLVFCAFQQARGKQRGLWRQVFYALMAACVGAIAGLHWYLWNWRTYWDFHKVKGIKGTENAGAITVAFPFDNYLADWIITLFWGSVIVVGIYLIIKPWRTKIAENMGYLMLFLFIPIFAWNAFYNSPYFIVIHTMPFTIFIILIICGGIELIGIKYVRWLVFVVLCFYGLSAHYISIANQPLRNSVENALRKLRLGSFSYSTILQPERNGWADGFTMTVNRLVKDWRENKGLSINTDNISVMNIMLLTLVEPYDEGQLSYCLLKNNVPFSIERPDPDIPFGINVYDYIVECEPVWTGATKEWEENCLNIAALAKSDKEHFAILDTLSLSEGKRITIYKRLANN
jgi:4-amino-4-deoxy-L-arabinose transferase-like glycosyltransferase